LGILELFYDILEHKERRTGN